MPIFYDDLKRFQGSVAVYDKEDNDTLWVRVYYNEFDRKEIDLSLKKVYTILHSDGNENTIPFLNVDAIDASINSRTPIHLGIDLVSN